MTGEGVTEPGRLSLGAELLMLAIDPANGGLLSRNRGRFREALATSYRSHERRWWWVPGIARRSALRELKAAGILERRPMLRLRLADRPRAARRFRDLQESLEQETLEDGRDRLLVMLLAWTGVLAARLSRYEREMAARRLRKLGKSMPIESDSNAPLTGRAPDPDWMYGLGKVAYQVEAVMMMDLVSDLTSGDPGAFGDFGTGGDSGSGGGDFSGGSDGGSGSN